MKQMITSLFILLSMGTVCGQSSADMQATISMIKKNLTQSNINLKNYSWLETTIVFVDGEQKSSSMNQCYYSVDGKLTKVPAGNATAAKAPGGLRGKMAASKKEDMEEYIQKCVALVKSYLPPNSETLQKIYGSGKCVISVLSPNVNYKLGFPGYKMPGDILSISVDKPKGLLTGIAVNSYIDKPEDAVVFNLTYNTLPDQTQFASETTLVAQAKKVKIVIQNSGYKKTAG